MPSELNTPAWLIACATTAPWCSKHIRAAKALSATAYVGGTLVDDALNKLCCRASVRARKHNIVPRARYAELLLKTHSDDFASLGVGVG